MINKPIQLIARLTKLLLRRGQRSQEDVEDLIQEAFLRLLIYERTAEVMNEEAFLVRTATHLAINEFHRRARVVYEKKSIEEIEDRMELADPGADPERRLDGQQQLDEVLRPLDECSELTRVCYLARCAGFSHCDIAEELGISERSVEQHIARARFLIMVARGLRRP